MLFSLLGEKLARRCQVHLLLKLDECVLLESWSLIVERDGLWLWLWLLQGMSSLLRILTKKLFEAFALTCASLYEFLFLLMSAVKGRWSGGSLLATVMSRRIAVEVLIVCRSTAVLSLRELLWLRQIVIVDLLMGCLKSYVGGWSHLPLMANLHRRDLSRRVDHYCGWISLSLLVF